MRWQRILDRAPEYTFALAALVAPPLAVIAPHGMVVELSILGFLCAILSVQQGGWRWGLDRPTLWMGAFVLWAGISLLWTPDPGFACKTEIKVLALAICGRFGVAMAPRGQGKLTETGLVIGIVLAVVILFAEVLSKNGISDLISRLNTGHNMHYAAKSILSRGQVFLVLMLWPLALMGLRRRSIFIIGLTVVSAVVLASGESLACRLALGAGGLLFVVTAFWARVALWAMRLGFVALLVGLPFAASRLPHPPDSFLSHPYLPLSAHHRLAIWQFAGEVIMQDMMTGVGMDASRVLPGGDVEVLYEHHVPSSGWVDASITGPRMPLHPHNAILQWWLELGLPGAVLFGIGGLWLIGRIVALPDVPGRASAAAMLASGLVFACVSFGFWQSWWMASLWIACMVYRVIPAEEADR